MRSVRQQSPRLCPPVPRDDSVRAQARSRRHRRTVQHEQLDPRGDHHDRHAEERRGARQAGNHEQQASSQLDYPGDVPEPLAPADVVKESHRRRQSQELGTAQIEEQRPHRELERAIAIAREDAALAKRILFLSRSEKVFHLWHVVHKPFSYTFAVLAMIHIGLVMMMGYM